MRNSDLFDAADYVARVGLRQGLDPALHYVIIGEHLGHAPSNGFDPVYYRERYPDVRCAAVSCLGHYLATGPSEGRRPLSVGATLSFDRTRLDLHHSTVLLIIHQASRTGAPILAYNIAMRLQGRYNVVAVLLAGGELVTHFEQCCAAAVGPLGYEHWHAVEAKYLVRRLLECYRPLYAIANSIESRLVFPSLAFENIPVVTLVNEFASYTRPRGAMGQALDWSTQVVFSAGVVASSAQSEHPTLSGRPIHILPQGRCDLPPVRSKGECDQNDRIRKLMRPKGAEDAFVVLGCGTVHIRKGVDLFLACAAAVSSLNPERAVRFVWIGQGYNPDEDISYSCYLADQISRSGLEGKIAILDEVPDLEPVYASADVFFLSSRLDPLPNVAIEAAMHGIPVICFEHSTGIADLFADEPATSECVVPYLDVPAAARVITQIVDDKGAYSRIGEATRRLASATFDMDRYVSRLDELGLDAVRIMRQRAQDFATVRDDPMFDKRVYLPLDWPAATREEAIIGFLARWTTVGTSRKPATNGLFRRPCAGFHPQIYAHENRNRYDTSFVNPLAHFIRSGKPDGPWCSDLITPNSRPLRARKTGLRIGLHAHFFYPELASQLMAKLKCNDSGCDLIFTTDSDAKAALLRKATKEFSRGEVQVRIVPNRGRDIGAFLTGLAKSVATDFDIVGHVHGKRSLAVGDAALGENWREFLWQNLIGDQNPMMDIVLDRFATDSLLGLVFPEDPHLCDWDQDREIAEELASRMNIKEPLPPFFNFPVGTMFWARTAALAPLLALNLDWEGYPEEPVPIDGTILHALERLLPFVAKQAGFGQAVTHVPRVTW
jgi:glycosyltransferase involved in cell wall biosynthesis